MINKKMKRVKLGHWYVTPGKGGSLSKGKTHCGCSMCTTKTKVLGYPKNQLSRIIAMKKEIQGYKI
ncbi:hypothetical protein J2T15_003488 [Paenibacillus harenae]|uniref:Uncharacterized protein n=1 Tax=Paenibacillus harenae TaxID=306543 RepID=A0ABT9U335_PAEHA|nr:hypothetical protein [Paenibacillus harenae]